jgi:hypothetical protein
MRKVPGQKPGTLIEFVPKSCGNLVGDEPPIRVWIRVPSEGDKRAHLAEIVGDVDMSGAEPRMRVGFATLLERKGAAIKRFVERVEGYAGPDDVPIVTAADLWERGEDAISSEVAGAIDGLLSLSAEEKKDSPASSVSPAAESSTAGTSAPLATLPSPTIATATAPGATLKY